MTDTLLLDGDCGLCHRLALFLRPRLKRPEVLRLIARDSPRGEVALADFRPALRSLDSVLLLRQGRGHAESGAALRTLLYLRLPWPMIGVLGLLIPAPLRDVVYRIVARNRRRFFPPPESCELP